MSIDDEKMVINDLTILIPSDIDAYQKHVESVIEANKAEVDAMLALVTEPFKPFTKVGACIASNTPYYYLDEKAYLAAAESGSVPTLPNKADALAYLTSRKMCVMNCCGFTHKCEPRLFGK